MYLFVLSLVRKLIFHWQLSWVCFQSGSDPGNPAFWLGLGDKPTCHRLIPDCFVHFLCQAAFSRLGSGCLLLNDKNQRIFKVLSSVTDPWHFGVDPDPDPAIFVIDLQEANKKLICLIKFFCLLLFGCKFTSFFKDKKSKRSHKTVESKVFFQTIFAWW